MNPADMTSRCVGGLSGASGAAVAAANVTSAAVDACSDVSGSCSPRTHPVVKRCLHQAADGVGAAFIVLTSCVEALMFPTAKRRRLRQIGAYNSRGRVS